jgi:hypothetical protein
MFAGDIVCGAHRTAEACGKTDVSLKAAACDRLQLLDLTNLQLSGSQLDLLLDCHPSGVTHQAH